MTSSSFAYRWVDSGALRGSKVHSVSRGFTCALLVVVEFILVREDSLGSV